MSHENPQDSQGQAAADRSRSHRNRNTCKEEVWAGGPSRQVNRVRREAPPAPVIPAVLVHIT